MAPPCNTAQCPSHIFQQEGSVYFFQGAFPYSHLSVEFVLLLILREAKLWVRRSGFGAFLVFWI